MVYGCACSGTVSRLEYYIVYIASFLVSTLCLVVLLYILSPTLYTTGAARRYQRSHEQGIV